VSLVNIPSFGEVIMSTSLLLKLSCGANLSRRVRSEQGLTLVEIIVVLIILSIIIAFVGTRILGAGDKAKADLTKLKMKDVRSSIEQYQLRYNAVPSNLQSLLNAMRKLDRDAYLLLTKILLVTRGDVPFSSSAMAMVGVIEFVRLVQMDAMVATA